MAKANILIVEDEKIVALDLKRRLISLDYSVNGIVSSAHECLKNIKESKPDLILMDIVLKGDIDGISVAKLIKAEYNIPIIYLTAHTDEMTIQRAKQTEPYGYIIKPFDLRDLQTTIEIALYKFKSEIKIAESEIKYRTLFNTAMDGVLIIDNEWKIISSNSKVFNLFGYSESELIEKDLSLLIPEFIEFYENKVKEKKHSKENTVELSGIRKKGARFPIDVSYSSWKVENSGFLTLILRDITKRKQYETSLIKNNDELEKRIKERTEELTSLIDQSPLAIRIFSKEGNLVYSNKTCEDIWDTYITKDYNLLDDEALNRYGYENQIKRLFSKGGNFKTRPIFFEPEEFDGMINKNELLLIFNFYSVLDVNGSVSRIVNLVENITERFKVEEFGSELEELKNRYAISLQKLEEEKYRISRELHDCIGQILTAVKINLEVYEKSNKINDKHINHAKKLLTEAGKEIKNIIHSLHPAVLDNYGLNVALKILCEESSETTGIDFIYTSNTEKINLQSSSELTIYRIIQEAFNNIAKHSGAVIAELKVVENNNNLLISVKDNGCGFELDKVNCDKNKIAYGIMNMKERIESISGSFSVDSSENNGTIINLMVPLNANRGKNE